MASYADILLGPLRTFWFKAFFVTEVVLFAGGFGIAQLGTRSTRLGAHPNFHFATGAVLGAIGVFFALTFLFLYAGSVVLKVRGRLARRMEF